MSDEQLLVINGLRDVRLPQPIGWWPLSPGWWVLAILLFSILGYALWLLARRWHMRSPQRQAAAALRYAFEQWQSDGDQQDYLEQSHRVLRQLAITLAGREHVSRLCGESWVDWLDQRVDPALSDVARTALAYGAYQRRFKAAIEPLHKEYMRWVAHA